ncbi:hypothetical protein GJ698_12025 [Pseudoduganella sp. FT26W]|uniref:DUF1640 domain-containing protein n=1 Tax=Duganella aquatilis TaxID=2666082 RepID=A0A844DBH7_9BURK|nr:hypothetical protein [Duganella aquatilis]MRW84809.1 hypothetical protein [Duganella aquatilis]
MNSVESAKYRKHLEEGGVPPQQATAHADALGEVLENLTQTLATKDWVHMQLQDLKFDMVKWMLGLFVTLFLAQTGVTIGAVVTILRYLPR